MSTHDQSSPDAHNPNESAVGARDAELQYKWKTRLKATLQLAWQEVQRVALVTLRHAHQLMSIVWNFGQRRISCWRLERQKVILGERMQAKGLGDTGLRNQISELDNAIQQAKANKQPFRQLARSRLALLSRLADPLPDASDLTVAADVERVQSIRLQLVDLEYIHQQQRETPAPTVDEWKRIAVGYGMTILFAVLGFGWLSSESANQNDTASMSDFLSSQVRSGASAVPVNPEMAPSMNATQAHSAVSGVTASAANVPSASVPGDVAAVKKLLQQDRTLSIARREIEENIADREWGEVASAVNRLCAGQISDEEIHIQILKTINLARSGNFTPAFTVEALQKAELSAVQLDVPPVVVVQALQHSLAYGAAAADQLLLQPESPKKVEASSPPNTVTTARCRSLQLTHELVTTIEIADQRTATLWAAVGKCYVDTGDFDSAKGMMKALDEMPQNRMVVLARSVLAAHTAPGLAGKDRISEAAEVANRIPAAFSELRCIAYSGIAGARETAGDTENATKFWNLAIQVASAETTKSTQNQNEVIVIRSLAEYGRVKEALKLPLLGESMLNRSGFGPFAIAGGTHQNSWCFACFPDFAC